MEVSNEPSSPPDKCLVCGEAVHFDVNTGDLFKFCESHLGHQQPLDLQSDSDGEDDQRMHPQQNKCAIEECSRPCHVDAMGVVHDCCGFTHAMEHIRRQMVKRK